MKIENERLRVNVLPELGASLGEFSYKNGGKVLDIFRKTDPSNATLKNISFFMMGPWVARIPNRKFFWQGKEISIEHPADPEKAIHGIFRQLHWKILSQREESINLVLQFKSGDAGYTFVSDFQAKVSYQLENSNLKLILQVTNTGKNIMPFSYGSHPMILKRTGKTLVNFQAKTWFPPDQELLVPKGYLENIPAEFNAPSPKELPPNWDHCLASWNQKAIIHFLENNIKLTLSAEDSHSTFLQCWSGAGREVFALEQQTAPANSFNLLHQGVESNGVITLMPEEEVKIVHTFQVE